MSLLEDFNHHELSVEQLRDIQQRVHAECPVARSEELGGFFILSRHADVRAAALDWEGLSSRDGFMHPKPPFPFAAIDYDPPEHGYWRDLFQESLNGTQVRGFAPACRAITERYVDGFGADGVADLVPSLAIPLPAVTIFASLGITEPDRAAEGQRLAGLLITTSGDHEVFMATMGEYAQFCMVELNARRAEPRDDFLTRLVTRPHAGKPIPDQTIIQLLMGFMLAGMHTSTAAIANLLRRVGEDAPLRDRLIAVPDLRRAAIEESMRLDTPLPFFFRVTTKDIEVDGTPIPAGSKVLLSFALANHDPAVFDCPEAFDMSRESNPHVAFGYGIHACVGAAFARMLLRVTLDVVLERLPNLRLADGEEPVLAIFGGIMQTAARLPMQWDVAG